MMKPFAHCPSQGAETSEPAVPDEGTASGDAEAMGENQAASAEQGEEEAGESDPVINLPGELVEDSKNVD